MKRAYADLPEGQMHYRIEGEGKPILMLHMAVGSSDEFSRVMHLLSKSYCTIAPDFLGAGDSDPTPGVYRIADHVRTVINFMDCLEIKQASIVGQFIGTLVATEIAINWPERVEKLVLSGAGINGENPELAPKPPENFTTRVELQRDGSHLMEWWRRSCLWGEYPLELLEERMLEYIKAGPRGEEMHWAGGYYDLKSRLPLIPCPTLVIDAPGYPAHYMAGKMTGMIPGGRLVTIPDGPMYLDRAMPEEYAEAILAFLAS